MSTTPGFIDAALESSLKLVPNLPEYKFYRDGVTIYYDDEHHAYTRFRDDGEYTEIKGVTTVVHIIDKGDALTQWAANCTRDYAVGKLEAGKAYAQDEIHQILNEATKHFTDVKNTAADIGKAAHNCLEDSIKKAIAETGGVVLTLVSLPREGQKIGDVELTAENAEKARHCAEHAYDWMQRHNVRWLFTERKVYHRIFDYAGTMDGLALVDACGDPDCCHEIVDGRRYAATYIDMLSLIDWKSSNRLYDEYRFQTAAYEAQHEDEFGCDIQQRFVLRLGKAAGDFEPWRIPAEDFDADFRAFLECLDLVRTLDEVTFRERDKKAELKAALKAEKEETKQAEKDAKKAERERLKAEKKSAVEAEKLRKAEEKAAAKAANARAHVKKHRKKKVNDEAGVIPEIGEMTVETAVQ